MGHYSRMKSCLLVWDFCPPESDGSRAGGLPVLAISLHAPAPGRCRIWDMKKDGFGRLTSAPCLAQPPPCRRLPTIPKLHRGHGTGHVLPASVLTAPRFCTPCLRNRNTTALSNLGHNSPAPRVHKAFEQIWREGVIKNPELNRR